MIRLTKVAFAAIALVIGASQANAGFVPVFINETPSGVFNYELQFSTANNSMLKPGDYVTLYDLSDDSSDFTVGGVDAGSFTITKQLLGVTPAGVVVSDSATLYNVTFTYTGGVLNTDTAFQIAITFPGATLALGEYSAVDQLPVGPNEQRGPVLVPVPEPTPAILMGMGSLVAGLFFRRKLRKTA